MGLKDINLNIDVKQWIKEQKIIEKQEMEELEKEEEEIKQRWIEKWGEEHWKHTNKITTEISNGITDIMDKKD